MIGETLGNRYRVVEDLGNGGMAWVYLAEDTTTGQSVAVKVLYPQFSQDMGYLNRFVREARLASGLTSPNTVRVLDYGSTRDIHYLVMEYIRGKTLRDLLDMQGCLPWRTALSIARQVALGLDHAAQFGIVHRDIKPQNLMVTEDGTVKVLDFGIARATDMPALTQSGFIGSPHYISPEQAMSEGVDIRSDIYSLGVVLFEMLTGKVPFTADNPWSIIKQHISDEPAAWTEQSEDIPSSVANLMRVAMTKRKEERFQSPLDLIQAIDQVLAGQDFGAVTTIPPTPSSPTPPPFGELLAPSQAAPIGLEQPQPVEDTLPARPVAAHPASHRWSLASVIAIAAGLALIVGGVLLLNQMREQNIGGEYNRAMQFYAQGDWEKALAGFDRVLALAPDYEDASFRKNEAIRLRELERLYNEGKTQYDAGDTAKAITFLSQLEAQDSTFNRPSVNDMLCDSYYRQAVKISAAADVKSIQGALVLLDDGAKVCPAQTAILSERKLLESYLQAAIAVAEGQWDSATAKLAELEEANSTGVDPRADTLLNQTYLALAQKREKDGNPAAALLYLDKALAIPGIDHRQAEQKRKELENLVATQPPIAALATSAKPTSTSQPTQAVKAIATPLLASPLGTPILMPSESYKYPAPRLVSPTHETIFTSGQFEKIVLTWEGPEKLDEDEYYDVTVLHFYTNEPVYWGTYTREKQLELSPGIGYSLADKDIFHWFVTIRRAVRVDTDGKPDGPNVSPKSEAWTFVWR